MESGVLLPQRKEMVLFDKEGPLFKLATLVDPLSYNLRGHVVMEQGDFF